MSNYLSNISVFSDKHQALNPTVIMQLPADDGLLFEREQHVLVINFANRFGAYPGGRFAYLGSQPQLGLWAQRRHWLGRDHLDRAAADGPNLSANP